MGEDAVEEPTETAGAPSPTRHLASEGHERNVNATSAQPQRKRASGYSQAS